MRQLLHWRYSSQAGQQPEGLSMLTQAADIKYCNKLVRTIQHWPGGVLNCLGRFSLNVHNIYGASVCCMVPSTHTINQIMLIVLWLSIILLHMYVMRWLVASQAAYMYLYKLHAVPVMYWCMS